MTTDQMEQLRHLFTVGARGIYDGDTLSGQTMRHLRDRGLAERRRSDNRNIITDCGIAVLFGQSPLTGTELGGR